MLFLVVLLSYIRKEELVVSNFGVLDRNFKERERARECVCVSLLACSLSRFFLVRRYCSKFPTINLYATYLVPTCTLPGRTSFLGRELLFSLFMSHNICTW